MQLQSRLFCDTVQSTATDHVLILNSAEDPFALQVAHHHQAASLTLAEDNISRVVHFLSALKVRHLPFHDYILRQPSATIDVALMNLFYQPGNAWVHYGLRAAHHALRPGGRLYVAGAKDRGILTVAKHMQAVFGNVETLLIRKGHRVLCSRAVQTVNTSQQGLPAISLNVFADSKLDEGTRLLLDALNVQPTDCALDLGCGAGFIGLHIARHATQGRVVMVDVSLAAVAASQQAIEESTLQNIEVFPSDGIAVVQERRFDLVATNPPFHIGGLQTTAIAERFIRETAQVLQPGGRFYLVANRFLKYEPVIRAHFRHCQEIHGNSRYKVLYATDKIE